MTSPLPSSNMIHARKPSIAERASAVFQEKLSLNHRRVSSKESSLTDVSCAISMKPEDYEMGVSIGQGASAIVYLATYKPMKKTICIKVIDLDMFERNQIDELRREIQIWSLSKHPNLLSVYGSFVQGSKLNIVAPFLSGGSILDIMKYAYKDGLDEASIATILKQALLGLEYLHKNGLIHRDVKAGNLLLDENGVVQLADFGVSSSLMDAGDRRGLRKTFVGTPCWMAPEVMEQSGYDYKADIWSFGITAIELATGQAPYARFPPLKVLMLTLQTDPPTLDREATKNRFSKAFKDMIDSCLQKDGSKRPTAEKLLQHAFFRSAKKPSYLVSAIINTIPPVHERAHVPNAATERTHSSMNDDEWDFDSPQDDKNMELKLADRPRGVSFRLPNEDVAPRLPSEDQTGFANTHASAMARKSRFVIDNASPATSPPMVPERSAVMDGGAPTFTLPPASAGVNPMLPSNGSFASLNSGEVKKGRFSVMDSGNQQQGVIAAGSISESAPSNTFSPPTSEMPLPPVPGTLERKTGRFAVQTYAMSPPSGAMPSPTVSVPDSILKASRKFTVSSDMSAASAPTPSINVSSSANAAATGAGLGDKRGRFEISLTGSATTEEPSSTDGSPSSSLSRPRSSLTSALAPPQTEGTVPEKYEALLKQSEMQKQVIQELLAILSWHGLNPYAPAPQQIPGGPGNGVPNPGLLSSSSSSNGSFSGHQRASSFQEQPNINIPLLSRDYEILKQDHEILKSVTQDLQSKLNLATAELDVFRNLASASPGRPT